MNNLIKLHNKLLVKFAIYNPSIYYAENEFGGIDVIIVLKSKCINPILKAFCLLNNYEESSMFDYKFKVYTEDDFNNVSKKPNSIEHYYLSTMRPVVNYQII